MLSVKYHEDFDRTMKLVLPFLIYSDKGDKVILAEKCGYLANRLLSMHTETDFIKANEEIIEFLNTLRDEDLFTDQIYQFESLQAENAEKFVLVDKRFKKMEKIVSKMRAKIGNMDSKLKKDHNDFSLSIQEKEPSLLQEDERKEPSLLQEDERKAVLIDNLPVDISIKTIKRVFRCVGEEPTSAKEIQKLATGSDSSVRSALNFLHKSNIIERIKIENKFYYESLGIKIITQEDNLMNLNFNRISIDEISNKLNINSNKARLLVKSLVKDERLIVIGKKSNERYVKAVLGGR